MPLYRVEGGELKQIHEQHFLSPEDIAMLSEQLRMYGDLLPERLLVIGQWQPDSEGLLDANGCCGYITLDRDGSLCLVLLCAKAPTPELVSRASDAAWDSRFIAYGELNDMANSEFSKYGIKESSLAAVHASFFGNAEAMIKESHFNDNQRLIVLAPCYSPTAIDSLRRHRLQLDIDAYEIGFINMTDDQGKRLIAINEVSAVGGNRLLSLLSAITAAPSGMLRELRDEQTETEPPALDSERERHEKTPLEEQSRRQRLLSIIARAQYSTKVELSILGALIATYIFTFLYLSVTNHLNYGTFGFDLGIFDQGVWLLSRFQEPFITIRGLNLFGDHLSFILLLVAPIYWIWADPLALLVLQTIALAIGAVPVFLIAKKKLEHSAVSLAFAAAYLLYPALQWINWDQFHPDSLATPLLLFAFYFVISGRNVLFGVCAALALLVKEDVSLVLIALGIYVAVTTNRNIGILTSTISLLWLIFGFSFIMPQFNSDGFFNIRNFSNLGSTPGQVVLNALTHPVDVFRIISQQQKLLYVIKLLAPLIFLPLVSLEIVAIALPPLFTNLVSQQGYMDSIQYHYTATIIPFLFIGAIYSVEKLAFTVRGRGYAAAGLILVALAANYILSPSPLSNYSSMGYWALENERRADIDKALSLIPADAAVSAQYNMVTHLAHRKYIYEFPNPFKAENWGIRNDRPHDPKRIQYIIVDTGRLQKEQRLLLDKLRNKEFKQIFNKSDIVVLERR